MLRNWHWFGLVILLSALSFAFEQQIDVSKSGEIGSLVRAEYGVPGHMTDVTWIISNLFDYGGISFIVGDSILGGDPAPGKKKILKVTVRAGWFVRQTREYAQGASVRMQLMGFGLPGKRTEGGGGTVFPELARGPWVVLHAEYGSGRVAKDVTKQLRGLTKNGSLKFTVNDADLGVKLPASSDRSLRFIVLEGLAGEFAFTFKQGQTVDLPMAKSPDAPAWTVTSALFGAPGHFADVTKTVQKLQRDDAFDFSVSTKVLGANPAPGVPNILLMRVRNTKGQEMAFQFGTGDVARMRLP